MLCCIRNMCLTKMSQSSEKGPTSENYKREKSHKKKRKKGMLLC